MNFSLYSGSDDDVLTKVLRGKPDIEKPDKTLSKNREEVVKVFFFFTILNICVL